MRQYRSKVTGALFTLVELEPGRVVLDAQALELLMGMAGFERVTEDES